jgi:hypothetical protein
MVKSLGCSTFLILLLSAASARAGFELAAPGRTARILVLAGESGCVRLAAGDLASDIEKISGQKPAIVGRLDDCSDNCIVLGSVARSESAELLARFLPDAIPALRGKWEAYQVETSAARLGAISSALVIAGSDERGAMFGLYAFIEQYLGIDPMYFWSGRWPKKRERLAFDSVRISAEEPTFRYRGWFLNDEDLLTEWREDGGKRHIEYPYYHRVTSPAVLERVFEAMLRLQYNLVIPASFTDITNPDEARMIDAASRRGLFVSTHHVEPLGVSGYAFQNYWRLRGRNVPFSFLKHRAEFEEVWRYYAAHWARYPNVVWQLGLRGIADRPVWASDPSVPESDGARGKLISDAMALQWEIIRSLDRRPQPPATTTLWMEGADLQRKGHLRFPPGVAVVFADNSPGWKLQPDFFETPREPGRSYGIYYHHALWGSGPHFVQAVSPQKTHEILKLAVERGSTWYCILNVANVREFLLGIDASARMLRDFASYDPERFLRQWCGSRFGGAAEAVEQAYRQLFASYVVDEKRGTPALLDGLTLHAGERIFAMLLSKRLVPSSARPADPGRLSQLLANVRKQRKSLELAGSEADATLTKLEGADRQFFETNFVAQQRMLLGLLKWVEGGIRATMADDAGDRAAYAAQLRGAAEGMKEVRAAQALASRGEWRDWYRGDRKMNLDRAEHLTRQLLAGESGHPSGKHGAH